MLIASSRELGVIDNLINGMHINDYSRTDAIQLKCTYATYDMLVELLRDGKVTGKIGAGSSIPTATADAEYQLLEAVSMGTNGGKQLRVKAAADKALIAGEWVNGAYKIMCTPALIAKLDKLFYPES